MPPENIGIPERERPRPTRAERRRLKRVRAKELLRRKREIYRRSGNQAKKFHF